MAEWSQESQGKITDTSGLSCSNTHRARSQFWRAWTDFWKLCVYCLLKGTPIKLCLCSIFPWIHNTLLIWCLTLLSPFILIVLFSLSFSASWCCWLGWVVAVFSHMSRSIDSVPAARGFGSAQQDALLLIVYSSFSSHGLFKSYLKTIHGHV